MCVRLRHFYEAFTADGLVMVLRFRNYSLSNFLNDTLFTSNSKYVCHYSEISDSTSSTV